MKKRILLKENENLSNSIIELKKTQSNNGTQILSMLNELGLSIKSFNSWSEEVEQEFRKEYPKASLDFCLDANGIKEQYKEAEAFYLKNQNNLSFEQLTNEEIEEVKEKYRAYATTEKQIEAYNLANSVVKDLNRLEDLGIRVNSHHVMNLCSVFHSNNSKVEVYTENLNERIISLK
jgi:TRAP-type uncharacterized transport system substrate-binding protein